MPSRRSTRTTRTADLTRRTVLGAGAAAAGAAAVGPAVLDASSSAASAASATSTAGAPSGRLYGDLRDIRHVVIMMQENRSFDHYFGSLKGVIGFGDRTAITLPDGGSVFRQPTPTDPTQAQTYEQSPLDLGHLYPWSVYDTAWYNLGKQEVAAQCFVGTDHGWDSQHSAWNNGLMDNWVPAKGIFTMGYLRRSDIPFQYALADAYTVGDQYHCSVMGPTDPNRVTHWAGTIDPEGVWGTPVTDNSQEGKIAWGPVTAADQMLKAGVSWKVYQTSDNYSDNPLMYMTHVMNAPKDSALYENSFNQVDQSVAPLNGDQLALGIAKDVAAGTLPQVSWVVTNQEFSEHPDGPPANGAYYVNAVLNDFYKANPDTFNRTLFIVNFDENDGDFDHVPPPTAPTGTADEFEKASGLPYGLGFRVPFMLLSPWTRGGKVTSEVGDHTSVLQFLERWTAAIGKPITMSTISAWRRQVCGDFTDAFDFANPVWGLPSGLPTPAYIDEAQDCTSSVQSIHAIPGVPLTTGTMPTQESGTKPLRPAPVQPNVNIAAHGGGVALSMSNTGPLARKASHFQTYHTGTTTAPIQTTAAPSTVAKPKKVSVPVTTTGAYDLTVNGPGRFLRRFQGDVTGAGNEVDVTLDYWQASKTRPSLSFALANRSDAPVTFTITHNHYGSGTIATTVAPGKTGSHRLDPLTSQHGWYDVTVTVSTDSTWSRRYTGHLENGQESITG